MPTWGTRNATLSTTPTRPGAEMSISPFSRHKTSGSAHCTIAIVLLHAARWAGLSPVISTKYRRIRVSSRGDRSIRGYKYKSIAPKYANGDLKGASKLITGSPEYQYNVTGKWWGAVFVDSGEAVAIFAAATLRPVPGRRALGIAGRANQTRFCRTGRG